MSDFYKLAISLKPKILLLFSVIYGALVLLFFAGAYFIFSQTPDFVRFYSVGVTLGRSALVLFCIVLTPGILKRFTLRFKWSSIIMVYRRQLGITVFLLSFTHFSFVRLLPQLMAQEGILDRLLPFEISALTALFFMFFLFITSNDVSTKLLKKYWYTIHKLIYLIAWMLFAHTILQGFTIWSITIGIFAILEFVSHIFFYFYKKKTVTVIKTDNSVTNH